MLKHAAIAMLVLTVGIVVFDDDGSDVSLDSKSLPDSKMTGELIETVSHGETVDVDDHLVDGRWTVVEFYADW